MLRLGVHQLPAAEAGLVRALLKLIAHGDRTDLGWSFADSAPYDGLIVDAAAPADPAQLRSQARVIAVLADGGNPVSVAPEFVRLVRPLRSEQLEQWLLASRLVLANTPAAPTARRTQALAGGRFKLKRWPPQEVLRNDARRMRMATFLSRRALTLDELASASHEPADKCDTFLQSLQSLGLLEVQAAPPLAPAIADRGPTRRAAPAAAQWELVRSIRRRLGLK